MQATLEDQKCLICRENNCNGANFGVPSCWSCRQFFEKTVNYVQELKCKNSEKCSTGCKFCKFKRCLRKGMSVPNNHPQFDRPKKQLKVIRNVDPLLKLNEERSNYFRNFTFSKDLKVTDLCDSDFATLFVPRRYDPIKSYDDWKFISIVTTVYFLRNLIFARLMQEKDRVRFVKNSFYECGLLFVAMDSCTESRELSFPDGTRIPETKNGASKENPMRHLLVQKLTELKITKNEFLLLLVVLSCTIGGSHLTQAAERFLLKQRDYFNYLLLKHCRENHGNRGNLRYADLIHLHQIIFQSKQYLKGENLLKEIANPDKQKKLLFESLEC